ncbi:MAG TPA: NUDIX hydrolase [Allosphingosinicella sp.]
MIDDSWLLLWSGSATVDSVDQLFSPRDWAAGIDSGELRRVEQDWAAALRKAQEQGRRLFDSPAVRLCGLEVRSGRLQLRYELTRYAYYVGARSRSVPTPFSGNPDPTGTVVIGVTADSKIPIGKRHQDVDANPGKFFCFGGFLHPTEDASAEGIPDAFACARREWREETGSDLEGAGLELISIVYDRVYPHPEMAFLARTAATSGEFVASRWDAELSDLSFVPVDGIEEFVRRHRTDFTESLVGAFEVLAKRYRIGRDAD